VTRIKKLALILAVLAVVAFLGHWIYRSLESDETRVRRLVTALVADFNGENVRAMAGAFAEKFRDATRKLDRRQVLQILQYVVLRARDAKAKRFALRAALVDDAVSVEIDPDGETARASFAVRIEQSIDGQWTDPDVCTIDAEIGKIEGDWQLVMTKHTWSRGRFRWRW